MNDWHIVGLEDRVRRLESENRDARARIDDLQFRLGMLPVKAVIALLWLLTIAMFAFAVSHPS